MAPLFAQILKTRNLSLILGGGNYVKFFHWLKFVIVLITQMLVLMCHNKEVVKNSN